LTYLKIIIHKLNKYAFNGKKIPNEMMIKFSLILIRLLNHENHVHFSELFVQLLNQLKAHGMKFKKIQLYN
jgi:hypothetical protein